MTIVNTKVEVIQLRIEGSKTEDEAAIALATIVLMPHAFWGGVRGKIHLEPMEVHMGETY